MTAKLDNAAAHEFAPLRFSTEAVPDRDRIAIWREVLGRQMLRLDIEPLPEEPFKSEMNLRALPSLCTNVITFSGGRLIRRQDCLADGNDDLALIINLGGRGIAYQRGREVALEQGEAVPLANDELGSLLHTGGRYIIMLVPRAALAARVEDLNSAIARSLPRNLEALRLLRNYLDLLHGSRRLVDPKLRQHAVNHVHDLTALALGPTRDAAVEDGGIRAARLHALKTDITQHLGEREFSIATVAARQGISPRYVQALFESEGITFSEFVLRQRLARVHSLLADPDSAHRRIGDIAFEAGFSDLSYFNKAFRRHYGATPSDVRAMGLRKDG